ncbi:hypothetical protein [Paraburkholderia hospita]|uniref:hypothetical protein n=1 Tax=Paraburkholderia hospita TaxID=169430 RepID=UPI003ED0702D
MTREERLKSDPVWAAEYHRKARERQRKRMSDPVVYEEIKRKNRERAAAKRPPRVEVTHKACVTCKSVFPATTEFFGPKKQGRLKLTSSCKPCMAHRERERRKDPEHNKKHIAAVYRSLKKRLATDSEFRAAYKEKQAERRRKRRANPEYWERELAKDREWRKANWHRVKLYKHKCGALQVFHVMQRHAAKLKATPFWSEREAIAALYEEARRLTEETGIEHHVDHIVPLRGKNVCGLHVFANLRVITADHNKRKANKLIEELLAA